MKLKWMLFLFVSGALFLAWLVFALFACVAGRRPLLPAAKWQAKAGTHCGTPMSIKTYRMLGHDMPLFVRVNGGRQPWDWFVVSISDDAARVSVPNTPRAFPYLGYNHDMWHGVDILDAKIEEKWFVSHTGDSVVFSNATLSVSVSPKTPP